MFCTSLLALITFAISAACHSIPANIGEDIALLAGNHRLISKRALSSFAVVVPPSALGCSDTQISQITSAIDDAKALARAASNALGITGSENSLAYQAFFGRGSYINILLC
ncbi:hypothetical protein J3E72DRAFT_264411 [Bipolaris maydis]|nr:hypothetical protein J3E72DRAFT_274058 [Bipolaris maydis]KAJ6202812.1 hypothetical protein J3E72DRAFT_264411 [Bipolaris maydis]